MKTDKILAFFLAIALFVVMPFIFSENLQDVEQSPRFLFMAAVLFVSSLLSIYFVIRNPVSLKWDKSYLIMLLFLLVNSIAFSRSINYGDGLFEFLKILIFYILFFQFMIVFTYGEKNKLVFFKTIGISALVFIVIGIFMLFATGSSIGGGFSIGRIDYMIASTLGNKNSFAETILLMLPITVLAIPYHRSFWKLFFIATSILILSTLAILQTLSTWLALAVIIVMLVIQLFRLKNKIFSGPKVYKRFYLIITGTILSFVLAAFIFLRVAGTAQIESRITAIQNMVNPEKINPDSLYQNSTYERISLWKNAIKVSKEHPLLGVGLGNWKIVAPAYGIGSALYMESGGIRFVHPHNDFLLIASELGLTGLLLFLWLLGMLLYYSWRISAKAETSLRMYLGLAMLSGLSAYIIIAIFSMPSNRIYPPVLFLLIAALIISEYNKVAKPKQSDGTKWLIFILLFSFTAASAAIYVGNIRMRSDFRLSAALLQDRQRHYNAMNRILVDVDKKYFPVDVTATPIAWYQGFAAFYIGDKEKAFTLFKEAEKVNPNHLNVLNDLGTSYNLSGDAVSAEMYYKKALIIQPGFGSAIVNLSIIYFNKGEVEEAYTTLIKYRGKIVRESVPVFSAILLAKAETLTKNTDTLDAFRLRLINPNSLVLLLKEINEHELGLSTVLDK